MARHTCIQFRGARERERERETKSQAAFKKRIAENTAKIEGGGVAVAWPGPARP